MTLNAINRERLYAQASKMDRLSTVYFGQFLPAYIDVLREASLPTLKLNILFDETSNGVTTDKPEITHGQQYFTNLSTRLHGTGCSIKSTEVAPGIFSIEVDKSLTDDKKNTRIFFDQVMEPRAFEFSKGLSMIPHDKYEEPLYDLAILLGDKFYLQYLPKIPGPTPFFTPKTQYRGKTTFEVVHYFNGYEKEMLKKQLFDIVWEYGVRKTIFAECAKREVAYEKLVPPGEEERQRWRIKFGDNFWIKQDITTPPVLEDMINQHDVLGFYPKLKQKIETDEGPLELQTRLVLEVDPRFADLEYVAFVFDNMTRAVNDLKLSYRRYHSGSLSPRLHVENDAQDILRNAMELCENFSFIGAGINKPILTREDAYNAIMRGVADCIFLYTWNKIRYYREPKITRNKFSPEYGLCLFDRPTNVTIAAGSAKRVIRLDNRTRKILEQIHDRYKRFPVTVTVCTPLYDYEPTPKTAEEILKLCNPDSAVERLNKMQPGLMSKMSQKLTSAHVKSIFEKTPRNQFRNLRVIGDNSFRKMYPKH